MSGFNLQELMAQAKQQYETLQKKMEQTVVEASAGGGSVTVKMDGRKQVLNIKIDPEVVKAGDVEMLQDLVMAALNEASRKVDQAMKSSVGGMLGGMGLGDSSKMSRFAEPMTRLIDELKKLPGVGSKSAQRLAFHILRSSDDDAEALASAVRDVKAKLRLCSICNNITDVDPCVYCSNPTRNQKLVCVVEEPTNISSVEKTRHFNGVYHVLHGAISPLHA